MLPGVLMSSGGQVFDMLYQLAELDEAKWVLSFFSVEFVLILFNSHALPSCRITVRARSLLKLIPTDPSVQDALDSLGQKVRINCSFSIHLTSKAECN